MSERRPSVFIGSSTEGLPIAEAIQQNLDYACDATMWSQGVFGLSGGTLDSLVDKLDNFDFAILVLTPDDLVETRKKQAQSPRDNVLLELGLFIGGIGQKRTFMVYDRTAGLKLPSDMAGVTPATYQPHGSGNLQASLGAACTQIKTAIQELGLRPRRKAGTEIDQTTQFQVICDLLDEPPRQILILMHETGQPIRRESMFGPGLSYAYAMSDRSCGHGHFSVDGLCKKVPDANLLTVDLRDNVSLTQRGDEFAKWLVETGKKALYFHCPLGSWGKRPSDFPDWESMTPPSSPPSD